MKRRLTRAEAQAFVERWRLVNAAEREELRSTPLDLKFRQLAALMASVDQLGWSEALAAEEAEVRDAGAACGKATMAEVGPLAPLVAALRDLLAWWQAGQIRGMIIGGVAASLLGRPRVTRDVDGVVWLAEDQWAPFLAGGARFGFGARPKDALAFARQARVLLVHHQPSGIDVDIAFAALPFEEEALARAQVIEVGGLGVPLPTPEDLIVMKAIAHRPRDQADITAVLDAHAKLNLRRVRRWVREFAEVLEMPEL